MAFLKPADGEEVVYSAAEAVPHAILRYAGGARTMIHRNLNDDGAGGVREHRHDAMKAVERKQRVEHGPFEGAQSTAGIAKINAKDQLARFTGDAGGNAAQETVLAIGAPSANEVVLFEFGEQFWKIRGIVLEVAVEGKNHGGLGMAEAGPERGALADVALVSKAADAGIGLMFGGDSFPGGVGAGVVHENEFERAFFAAKSGDDFPGEGPDVVGLVEHRYDYRNNRVHSGQRGKERPR